MVGITWFVQVVHYPLLDKLSKYRPAAYEQSHIRLATWVVAPPMVVEMLSAVAFVFIHPSGIPSPLTWAGLSLVLLIWLSTATLQAPKHEILALQYVETVHRSLVRTNWIRTVAWSLRGLLLLYALFKTVPT